MAKYKTIIFNIQGMYCTACALRLEKQLISLNGVQESVVNFASNTTSIIYDPKIITIQDLIDKAKRINFTLSIENREDNSRQHTLLLVILSWSITLLLMLPMFSVYIPIIHSPIGKILISGLVLFIVGFSILKSAWSSIFNGTMGMDVLIAIGSLAAWISSVLPLIGINIPDYSMTTAMLISVNMTGRLLESIARRAASKTVTALADFGAKTASKITSNGTISEIPVSELKVGDKIQIKAGDKIPTDGIIISGKTSTDESFLTGESLPLEKGVGDYIFGASINLDGFITIKVEKESTTTLLAQTIKLVQEAQGTKVPIQLLADKITKIFVPIILTFSFLTFAIWIAFPELIPNLLNNLGIPFVSTGRLASAISSAIAVLVIACPCALGLATPMALVNGSALGAKKGILIRRGAAIQTLTKIDIIALDKTGTLTIGKPKVISIFSDSATNEEAIKMLAGLEKLSTHPLATAVTNYAKEHNIESITFSEAKSIPGQGIFGVYNDIEWFAGSLKSTNESNIYIPDTLKISINECLNKGETLVCLSNISQNKCEVIVSFADKVKQEAMQAIKTLQDMNKKIIMITGDHNNAAMTIAKELGIDNVISDSSPKQKLETVESLKQQNYNVCFVGDGINDTAALEASNVGIAMGTGTDIAAEAGDIILISGSLVSLVSSFRLAHATFNKIKQNLFWAFIYNIIAIPLAFSGLLHPVIAEIAMSFSSLTVIGNSLLLSRKKI